LKPTLFVPKRTGLGNFPALMSRQRLARDLPVIPGNSFILIILSICLPPYYWFELMPVEAKKKAAPTGIALHMQC
jgi:hypothetical protein